MSIYRIITEETYYKHYVVEANSEQEAKNIFNSDKSRVQEVRDEWGDDQEIVRVYKIKEKAVNPEPSEGG